MQLPDDRIAVGLLTVRELAQLLNVSAQWIRSRAADGSLPGYKVGNSWRFDTAQITDWLSAQGNAATTPAHSGSRATLQAPLAPAKPLAIDLESALSDRAVASELGVSTTNVRNWIKAGILPGVQAGRSWLIDSDAFDQWRSLLAEHPTLETLAPGRLRAWSIRVHIQQGILHACGIGNTVGSWERHGRRVPTWAEAMPRKGQGN